MQVSPEVRTLVERLFVRLPSLAYVSINSRDQKKFGAKAGIENAVLPSFLLTPGAFCLGSSVVDNLHVCWPFCASLIVVSRNDVSFVSHARTLAVPVLGSCR